MFMALDWEGKPLARDVPILLQPPVRIKIVSKSPLSCLS